MQVPNHPKNATFTQHLKKIAKDSEVKKSCKKNRSWRCTCLVFMQGVTTEPRSSWLRLYGMKENKLFKPFVRNNSLKSSIQNTGKFRYY